MPKLCPNCNIPTGSIKTVIVKNQLLTGCDKCLDTLMRPNELSAQNRREYQRGEYRKDILQPWERDYAKAYGAEQARERGWSDDAIRKFG